MWRISDVCHRLDDSFPDLAPASRDSSSADVTVDAKPLGGAAVEQEFKYAPHTGTVQPSSALLCCALARSTEPPVLLPIVVLFQPDNVT